MSAPSRDGLQEVREISMNTYEIVSARILESLERGVVPWRKPWSCGAPRNLFSGHEYRGVNVLILRSTRHASPFWLTYRQARMLGGSVRRGEHGYPIVFWNVSEQQATDGAVQKRFVLRHFTVFNAEQTEGVHVPPSTEVQRVDPIAECEQVVAGYVGGPVIRHGGGRACYFPALDEIRMPPREQFTSSEEYYSTLFHELAHSTGAVHRLARKGVINQGSFAAHGYAFEELVAECTSAFLAAHAGISLATLDNSAAYIASWAKKLRSEPRWIVDAASQAAKAADRILGRRTGNEVSDAAAA